MIDVVELLSRPGSDRLRYSDIARELNLTLATTHAILKTLCDRGWISRDPATKTFALGPGLAPVAAAVDTRPFVASARAAAIELAAEFGYAASVTEKLAEGSLVISAFVGGERLWPGDRIPYAPPFGAAFAAWDTEAGRQGWITRAAPAHSEIAQQLADVLRETRARGFDVDCTSPAVGRAASLLTTLDTGTIALPQNIRETLDRLRVEFTTLGTPATLSGTTQPVAAITAPVLDRAGHAVLLVAVHPLVDLGLDRIEAIGRHVAGKAAAITESGALISNSR
ncbi:helix-turn-helix domain-containing protein [Nocardia blacklockiae]|uniref:helix-turn-helix domain-containing protein n=1 Tax=Nocardia blacklockiae TaxID=480036 RepID=UPI00189482D9|nr:helix-turn-helix domain-containing protein [Nocardia blacklockiae]MBF6175164.1 helix-turn-helix domain-containing protein [Nocardia blacklockiae]